MIKYESKIKSWIFILNIVIPLLCGGFIYFVFSRTGYLLFDFFLALSLGLGIFISSMFSKKKFLYYIRLSPDKLQVKYLSSFLKAHTVLFDLSRLSEFELREKNRLSGNAGEINLKYKGIWQQYLITDRKLLVWMQENLLEPGNKERPD